ncbi:hypothetical protein GGR56DRAFT_686873 [Xylariaceae sp. FL0804]|nr:hypothetical protein GGR56DRAFT_686873 [Xylariaceae sp. FL0804]
MIPAILSALPKSRPFFQDIPIFHYSLYSTESIQASRHSPKDQAVFHPQAMNQRPVLPSSWPEPPAPSGQENTKPDSVAGSTPPPAVSLPGSATPSPTSLASRPERWSRSPDVRHWQLNTSPHEPAALAARDARATSFTRHSHKSLNNLNDSNDSAAASTKPLRHTLSNKSLPSSSQGSLVPSGEGRLKSHAQHPAHTVHVDPGFLRHFGHSDAKPHIIAGSTSYVLEAPSGRKQGERPDVSGSDSVSDSVSDSDSDSDGSSDSEGENENKKEGKGKKREQKGRKGTKRNREKGKNKKRGKKNKEKEQTDTGTTSASKTWPQVIIRALWRGLRWHPRRAGLLILILILACWLLWSCCLLWPLLGLLLVGWLLWTRSLPWPLLGLLLGLLLVAMWPRLASLAGLDNNTQDCWQNLLPPPPPPLDPYRGVPPPHGEESGRSAQMTTRMTTQLGTVGYHAQTPETAHEARLATLDYIVAIAGLLHYDSAESGDGILEAALPTAAAITGKAGHTGRQAAGRTSSEQDGQDDSEVLLPASARHECAPLCLLNHHAPREAVVDCLWQKWVKGNASTFHFTGKQWMQGDFSTFNYAAVVLRQQKQPLDLVHDWLKQLDELQALTGRLAELDVELRRGGREAAEAVFAKKWSSGDRGEGKVPVLRDQQLQQHKQQQADASGHRKTLAESFQQEMRASLIKALPPGQSDSWSSSSKSSSSFLASGRGRNDQSDEEPSWQVKLQRLRERLAACEGGEMEDGHQQQPATVCAVLAGWDLQMLLAVEDV